MRTAVKKAVFGVLFVPLLVTALASGQTGASIPSTETPGAFADRIRELLQGGDVPAYLQEFAPDIRAAEGARLAAFFDDLKMTNVSLRLAGIQSAEAGAGRVFLQAFFENAFAAIIESWTLAIERREAGWVVVRLEVTGSMIRMCKVLIPAERAERARRVEVTHADVRFTFTAAAVFYDNIPDSDTALVIVGRGKVVFTPSDANERHQLELIYKKNRIEADIDFLYARLSPGFFASHVRIETEAGLPAVTTAERDKAAEVFSRNYPRSFTIENPLDKSLLSFIPQGDEAVLEFQPRKGGDLAYIYYPFSNDAISLYDHGKERVICLYSPAPAPGPPLKKMFISFEEKFDVSSYALELGYVPAYSYLSAKARIEVVPKVDQLDILKFRFNPDLEILKITDEEDRELFYTVDKIRKLLYVHFIAPPAARAPTVIEVFYRGRMLPAAPATDVIALPDFLTDRVRVRFRPRYETYFFSHAGFWYPGPAEDDYFPARMTIVLPPEYNCVATGELVAEGRREEMDDVVAIERAGSAVYTFVSRSPVKYLSFIVGRLKRKKERAGPVSISTHVSTEVLDSRPAIVDQAADILEFYGRAFGPYPYENLKIVLRLWTTLGGHSPPSFIVINEVPLFGDPDNRKPVDAPVDLSAWKEHLLAHEIAHQWWGHEVSFDSYKDQWLSEGFAQFASASYLRYKYGEAAFTAILKKFARWTEKKSFRGPIVMGSRLSYQDFEAYQSIVYDKATLALFMLQDLLGRETFEAGVRSFLEKFAFKAARTGEFIAAMEAASGRNLRAFFQGWFYSWELPEVVTTWTETHVPEGVRLDLKVTQVKGHFVFPLWIEWTSAGETGREKVIVDETTEEISLTLREKPRKVRVNPDKAVPGNFR